MDEGLVETSESVGPELGRNVEKNLEHKSEIDSHETPDQSNCNLKFTGELLFILFIESRFCDKLTIRR